MQPVPLRIGRWYCHRWDRVLTIIEIECSHMLKSVKGLVAHENAAKARVDHRCGLDAHETCLELPESPGLLPGSQVIRGAIGA